MEDAGGMFGDALVVAAQDQDEVRWFERVVEAMKVPERLSMAPFFLGRFVLHGCRHLAA